MKLPQLQSLILALSLGLSLNLGLSLAMPTPNHHVTILVPMRLLDNRLVFDVDAEHKPLMLQGSPQNLPRLVWNPSARLLYTLSPERRPVALAVIFLWLLLTCWYFLRPYDSDEEEQESDRGKGGVSL
ncbi:hypothetical protein CP533_4808 [Ophiocordyceps camponoti-saundersi (nom. inval.)]|nr:hypothetical protein CP533_4808 [Ophiocordyceps camponoti-saundersi (nom. inval.)]